MKARLYNKAMVKTESITFLKLIHICVDYSANIKTILAEMQAFFATRNRLLCTNPISLDKILHLSEILDLPLEEVLQGLTTTTTFKTNPNSSRSGLPKDPGSNARSKPEGVMEAQSTKCSDIGPRYDSTASDRASF